MRPEIPLLLYAAAGSAALPLAALAVWRGGSPAHRWVLATCLLSLLADGLGLVFALQRINNHVVSYFFTPLLGAAMVLLLAQGQRTVVARQAVVACAWLLLLVTLGLAVAVEDRASFSAYAAPLRSLLVLALALWTLLHQDFGARSVPMRRAAWFWIPLGLALYSGVSAAYFPLARGFAQEAPEFVRAMALLRAGLVIVAFVLIAWGVACLSRPRNSGRPLSPSSSPSPSS